MGRKRPFPPPRGGMDHRACLLGWVDRRPARGGYAARAWGKVLDRPEVCRLAGPEHPVEVGFAVTGWCPGWSWCRSYRSQGPRGTGRRPRPGLGVRPRLPRLPPIPAASGSQGGSPGLSGPFPTGRSSRQRLGLSDRPVPRSRGVRTSRCVPCRQGLERCRVRCGFRPITLPFLIGTLPDPGRGTGHLSRGASTW